MKKLSVETADVKLKSYKTKQYAKCHNVPLFVYRHVFGLIQCVWPRVTSIGIANSEERTGAFEGKRKVYKLFRRL